MKKSIFNLIPLSVLFLLGACSMARSTIGNLEKVPATSILNTQLARTFTGAANDQSITINETTGTAGIESGGIIIASDANGVFTSAGTAIVTLADADNTSTRQIVAMQQAVKTAVDTILNVSDNNVLGLSTESSVVIRLITGTQGAIATVTLSTTDDYLFEDNRNTKTFIVVLAVERVPTTSILNTQLARTFTGAANDQSITINETTGTAGIESGGIIIASDANGVFTSAGTAIVTLADADNTSTRQIVAMQQAVKTAVDAILNVSDNNVLGLSKESSVVVRLSGIQGAEATVTLSTTDGYLFEDNRNTKTFIIVLTRLDIVSIIDSSAFNVPATPTSQGTAGTASFTIPVDFNDVTIKVPTYFHNKDNLLYNEKKDAVTKTFKSMPTPIGVEITAIEEDIHSSKVTITFGAKDGYRFIDHSPSKRFTIYLSGYFGDGTQTIEEPSYFVPGFGVIPSGIQLDPGFVQHKRLVHATVRGNVNNQKIAVMQALDQMFYNASIYAPLLPEGIKYTKKTPRARVKLDAKGKPMLYDNQGYFIVTLPQQDGYYIFNQADKTKKEITIRVQWLPGY